jgi:hypothetical protein
MKRLVLYDAFIALAVLSLWVVIVLVEVKGRQPGFGERAYLISLVFPFVAFPAASLLALRDKSGRVRSVAAALSLLCIAPAFIVFGVLAVWYFKMAIGGGIS